MAFREINAGGVKMETRCHLLPEDLVEKLWLCCLQIFYDGLKLPLSVVYLRPR